MASVNSQPLIVPIQLVTGSLHFAEIHSEEGTVQDAISFLTKIEGVRREILGEDNQDGGSQGWALQKVREERSGRTWEEDELMALGDG